MVKVCGEFNATGKTRIYTEKRGVLRHGQKGPKEMGMKRES